MQTLGFSKHGGGPALELLASWASPPHLSIACDETRTVLHPHGAIRRVPGDHAVGAFSQEPGSKKARTPGSREIPQHTRTHSLSSRPGRVTREHAARFTERKLKPGERSGCAPSHPAVLPAPAICKARASRSQPTLLHARWTFLAGHRKFTGIPAPYFHLPETGKSAISSQALAVHFMFSPPPTSVLSHSTPLWSSINTAPPGEPPDRRKLKLMSVSARVDETVSEQKEGASTTVIETPADLP